MIAVRGRLAKLAWGSAGEGSRQAADSGPPSSRSHVVVEVTIQMQGLQWPHSWRTFGLIPAAGSDERSTPLKGLFFTVGCGMLSSG